MLGERNGPSKKKSSQASNSLQQDSQNIKHERLESSESRRSQMKESV